MYSTVQYGMNNIKRERAARRDLHNQRRTEERDVVLCSVSASPAWWWPCESVLQLLGTCPVGKLQQLLLGDQGVGANGTRVVSSNSY